MQSILEEAQQVVGQRQTAYGSREDNFGRIAALWSAILNVPVTAQQVALCMIAVKIARECWKPARDNRVDIAGYADCLDCLNETRTHGTETAEAAETASANGNHACRTTP